MALTRPMRHRSTGLFRLKFLNDFKRLCLSGILKMCVIPETRRVIRGDDRRVVPNLPSNKRVTLDLVGVIPEWAARALRDMSGIQGGGECPIRF